MCSVLGVCIHHSQVRDSDSNEVMGSAEDRVFETNPLSLAVHIILYAYSNSCMYSCADSCNMDYVTILHVVRAKLHHLAALDLSSGISRIIEVNIKHDVHYIIRRGMSIDFNHVLLP